MSLSTTITRVAPTEHLWLRLMPFRVFFPGSSKRVNLHLLPMDILLDEIFCRLDLRDIFMIRQVNKALYAASKHPALWRRLIWLYWTIQPYLPPLPPSIKYSAAHLSVRDIEAVATRSLSLEMNWTARQPAPYRHNQYQSYHHTYGLFILPGSHYLVQAAVDHSGNHCIMLWAMDHPAFAKDCMTPLAVRYINVKAYGLQARYMTVKGKPGITISFLRKTHKDSRDRRHIPEVLALGGDPEEEDEYIPLQYELTVLHVLFEDLNSLVDRRLKPGTTDFLHLALEYGDIFNVVGRTRSAHQLGMVSLGELDGQPYAIAIKHPDSVHLINLDTDKQYVLKCPNSLHYPDSRHTMWNLKILPVQNHLMIVRKIERTPGRILTACVIETFSLPPDLGKKDADTLIRCEETKVIGWSFIGVQLSEPYYEFADDPSIAPQFTRHHIPQPLSVYFQSTGGVITLVSFWPIKNRVVPNPDGEPLIMSSPNSSKFPTVYYSMALLVQDLKYTFTKDLEGAIRVLPGSRRAMFYRVSKKYARTVTPKVSSLIAFQCGEKGRHYSEAYLDPEDEERVDPIWPETMSMEEQERREVEGILTGTQQSHHKKFVPKMAVTLKCTKGEEWEDVMAAMSAAAWDETTGRFVATSALNGMIHIWDFAYKRYEDAVDARMHEESDQVREVLDSTMNIE